MSLTSFFYEIPNGKMHFKGPETLFTLSDASKPLVLFLHGASRETQNTSFWNPILAVITRYTFPILVDALGHGETEYAENISTSSQITALKQLIHHLLNQTSFEHLSIVGRSYGGVLTQILASELEDSIQALGLIAPAAGAKVCTYLANWKKPVTVLWDVDDPVISFSWYAAIKATVTQTDLFTVGDTTEQTISSMPRPSTAKPSHAPEIIAPQLFDQFLAHFCDNL